jgi:uncharacterized OB-fold protein
MSDWLLPPLDTWTRPFYEGCRAGELRVQRCSETGRLVFPPRPFSPFAPHAALEWNTLSGRGTIWSFAVPHPPLLPAYAAVAPYNVIAVALEEDPTVRLIGNLVSGPAGAIDEIDPATIRIGASVRVVFDPLNDEIHLPRWVPA